MTNCETTGKTFHTVTETFQPLPADILRRIATALHILQAA
jgi:hypothetical protein